MRIIFVAAVLLVASCYARQVSQQEISARIFNNYERNTRPNGLNASLQDGGPVFVYLQLFVRNVELSDDSMELRTQLTIRQRWKDQRLAYAPLFNRTTDGYSKDVRIAGGNTAYQVWQPDLFISNEKRSSRSSFSQSAALTVVSDDGGVKTSQRVLVDFFCPLSFHWFPREKNACSMDFASYGFTSDDIVYQWDKAPLQFKQGQEHVGYKLVKDKSSTVSCASQTSTGTYSCVRAVLQFERDGIQPLVIHFYLPTALLVLISWISFFLPKRELVARLLLILIPLLLIILVSRHSPVKVPVTNYNKGDDTWFIWCLIFILAALIQFLLVTIFYGREVGNSETHDVQKNDNGYKCCPSGNLKSDVCDFVARIFFPLAFLVFLIAYFAVYA